MKLLQRRRDVALAELHLQIERERWGDRSAKIRENFRQHRIAWTLGGGFASGLIAGWIPYKGIARTGGLLTGALGFVLRSPIGAMLMQGATARATAAATPAPSADPS